MEYEYKTVHNYGTFSNDELNKLAQFGWRLIACGAYQRVDKSVNDFYYIFERVKT